MVHDRQLCVPERQFKAGIRVWRDVCQAQKTLCLFAKCPNSISTGEDSTETGGLVESEGCKLAPVIKASKNRTATPLGGVSPMVKLMGTPLLGATECIGAFASGQKWSCSEVLEQMERYASWRILQH